MATTGKLYSELIQTWTMHKASYEERKVEVALEVDETRKEFDDQEQEREAEMDIRIDDLRHTDEQQRILKKEAAIEVVLDDGKTTFGNVWDVRTTQWVHLLPL